MDTDAEIPANYCPNCKRPMQLVLSLPSVGPGLPELHFYACSCGASETTEVKPIPPADTACPTR